MNVKPCRDCRRPVSLARRADDTSRWVVLDAAPVRPESVRDGHNVRVMDAGAAYTLAHMREHLDMRFAFETDRGPIEDFPHHTVHDCPKRKDL